MSGLYVRCHAQALVTEPALEACDTALPSRTLRDRAVAKTMVVSYDSI